MLISLVPCAFSQDTPHGFLKPFSVDSFVYSTTPDNTHYQFRAFESKPSHFHVKSFSAPGGTVQTSNPDGLECPVCKIGLPNRTRYSAPPFGVNEGLALKPGSLSAQWGGSHLITNDQYNDQGLVQSHLGVRFFLDHEKHVSFGFTKGYMYNASPFGAPGWTSTTGDLTITIGNGPAEFVANGMKKFLKLGRRQRAEASIPN